MKIVLAIGVVLSCAQISLADIIDKCEPPQDVQFNQNRQWYADQYQIANMFEMSFDPKLEEIARQFGSCDQIDNGPYHRTWFSTRLEDYEVFRKYTQKHLKKPYLHSFLELAHPLQTGIIECKLSVTCYVDTVEEDGSTGSMPLQSITLYGPIATVAESDFIYGPPGSKCPNGTSSSHVGLCLVPKPKKKIVKDNHHHDELEGNVKMRKKEKKMAGEVNFFWLSMIFSMIYLV